MSSTWIWSLYTGLALGAVLCLLVLVPLLVLQYRRYGALTGRRLVGSLATAVYLAGVFSYTMLPLPDPATLDCSAGHVLQLNPWQAVTDIAHGVRGLTLAQALVSDVVLQVVFNVVLFLPWGVLARGFFQRSLLVSSLSALAGSVLVEASQYTGLWGLYACSYRTADIDDVITNSLGGLIGALAAPLVLAWMPSSRTLQARRSRPRPLGAGRRLFAIFLDAAGLCLLVGAVDVVWVVTVKLCGGSAHAAAGSPWMLALSLAASLAYILFPALTGTGASPGQKLVWLAPEATRPDQPVRSRTARARHLVRACAVEVPGAAALCLLLWRPGAVWTTVVAAAALLWALAEACSVPLTRHGRGLSYALGGIGITDARAETEPPHGPEV